MFIAQAHSFMQQARLAITLAWVAGYTNVLSILTCGHVTSHASGTTSDLGQWVVRGTWDKAGFACFLLVSFFLGAMVSGGAIELGRRRTWESIYVLPMAIEAALLALFAVGVELHDAARVESGWALYAMTGLASMAMGLQNATITRISGGVVRTTHVTGVLTDLGTEVVNLVLVVLDKPRSGASSDGAAVRGVARDPVVRRTMLLFSIIGSFALGAGLGTLAFEWMPRWAMLPPVCFLLWMVYQDLATPIAEIGPSELVENWGLDLPPGVAVYHMKRDPRRAGRVHRFPNMLAWAERLPRRVRVVVLDLGMVTLLDHDAAMELRATYRTMRAQGRTLLISGLSDSQVRELREAGAGELLDPSVVCQDLELAIARAMAIVGE
jgi:uncharacterized membrane protein YoaK (UPF0700 family)/anti-anti-sigma regulatory factor